MGVWRVFHTRHTPKSGLYLAKSQRPIVFSCQYSVRPGRGVRYGRLQILLVDGLQVSRLKVEKNFSVCLCGSVFFSERGSFAVGEKSNLQGVALRLADLVGGQARGGGSDFIFVGQINGADAGVICVERS